MMKRNKILDDPLYSTAKGIYNPYGVQKLHLSPKKKNKREKKKTSLSIRLSSASCWLAALRGPEELLAALRGPEELLASP